MKDFHDLIKICQGKNIFIQTHNFPDPDAIGSAYALKKLLEHFDIASVLCCRGDCDKLSVSKMVDIFDVQFIFGEEEISAVKTYGSVFAENRNMQNAIICVDTQKHNGNMNVFSGNVIACIDHHPVFQKAAYEFEEIQSAGACTTLIAKYYQDLNVKPDPDAATAMLYGMRMDTLQFTRGVTQLDIEMFGYLFPYCDKEKLFQLEHNNMCLKDLRAYGAVIDSIAIYENVGFAYIPFGCPDGLVATMSDFILDLEEVAISIVCCQRADGIKLSVRSELPGIHAGQLIFWALEGIGSGGGHLQMAGGLVKQDMVEKLQNPNEQIRSRFLKVLDKMRHMQEKNL